MEQVSKSLSAFDRAFAKLGKEGLEAIIARIDSMDIKGPTIEEYLSDFEAHYEHLFENICDLAKCSSEGSTFTVKCTEPHKVSVLSAYNTYWKDHKPDKEKNKGKKSTTVENNGGFLFRFAT